jgi:hypothetical protein
MKRNPKLTKLGLVALGGYAALTAVGLSDTANAATRHHQQQYGVYSEWTPRVYDRFSGSAGEGGYDPVPPSANN